MLHTLGSSLLLALPSGVVLGLLTERVALRPPFGKRLFDARLWNALVKAAVAIPVVHVLFAASGLRENGKGAGDAAFTFATWIVCCCAGARFGSALQPVGLTGGIACGKSTAAKMLTRGSGKGKDAFAVIDTDAIAHDILLPHKMGADSAYHKVLAAFGDGILEDGSSSGESGGPRAIDRRKLGDIIFRDRTQRRRLNAITHPLITKVMLKKIVREGLNPSREDTSVVSVDIPLLYEVGYPMRLLVGLEVVVACTPSVQLGRLMKRNTDLTKEQCEKRIESQMPIDRKAQMADFVIWNDGSMEQLEDEVERVRNEIRNRVNGWGFTLPKLVVLLGVGAATFVLLLNVQM